ncbi:MAG: endonuclease/exonuclease/phosphatase family protein [Microgenomates group bacterium]
MRFKFIQLNLWFSGKLLDNAIEFLNKERPDILALQEVYWPQANRSENRFNSLQILKKELGLDHMDFAPSFLDVGVEDSLWGLAVMSKYPLIKSQSTYINGSFHAYVRDKLTDFGDLPRNLQHSTIEINNAPLHILNIHGIWGFDENDNERRLEMADRIIAQIPFNEPTILCGDLNVGQHTKTIAKLERRLRNVFKGELTTSFNTNIKKGGGFATSVVDFVFVSNHLRILNHTAPLVDVSDHLPLVCEFEI